ncbi:hypothetical protein D9613_006750 [Agrocybe pediades]|uniref:Uncharacterized protein n=1 Tax=Agrocybe pediades TaxID=84607 RepID=A0A8H4QHP1_9AGAR|nr:hypothetical protein D9613_006750 [Agrocybe pediades]
MEGIHGPRGLTMLVRLCEILPELQSLTTLRLFEQSIRRSSTHYHINMGIGRLVMRLEEVLNKGIFPRLRTVHCDRCFLKDVGLLFKSRPSLQVFSTDLLDPIELRVLQEMEHNHTESIPAIYVEDSVPELFVQVMVFPGLYSPARVPSILKALENHWRHLDQQVIRIHIYIAAPTQIEAYASAKDSCAIIPNRRNVTHLNLLFERPYDIPAGEVVDIFGTLPALVELKFMRYSLNNSAELEQTWQTLQRTAKSENERLAKVQAWSNACPSLRRVTFSTIGEAIVHEIH